MDQIVLMIALGRIEALERFDFGDDGFCENMGAIQLGIANSIGSLASKPERDILMQDFAVIENVAFPPSVLCIFFHILSHFQ